MSQVNVARAWKDDEYRGGLTEAERASLPENPAGLVELPQTELQQVAGGVFQLLAGNPTIYFTLRAYGCTLHLCPIVHKVE
jgi:mersacidin/lichenicidin family type 2 lantibiotic